MTPGPPRGIRVVPQATRVFQDTFTRHAGPDGCDYYWLGGGDFEFAGRQTESDLNAVDEGFVAITPLQFDLTRYELLEQLKQVEWKLISDR